MKHNIVALVPLREGSKSIPLKNLKAIAGKPLCAWVLEAACEAIGSSNVFVSTESKEIANVVNNLQLGVNIIERPDELATDTTSTESVMLHFAKMMNFDILITLQATSPLTRANDIQKALDLFNNNNFDSLLTGVSIKRFFWTLDRRPVNYNPMNRPFRHNIDRLIIENGAFYITKYEILQRYKCRLGGKIGIYEMAPERVVEIDEMEDWTEVERYLIDRKRQEINKSLKDIKLIAVDVDGTLTDAGMYYSANGEEFKKFNTKDAQGLASVRERGFDVAIITKEISPIVRARAEKLKIDKCYVGIDDKLGCLKDICRDLKINLSNVAYVGDDISDLECIKSVGFSACPSDAVEVVKNMAHYICRVPGGFGAVREVCELIWNL